MYKEHKKPEIVTARRRRWPMIVGISIGGVIGALAILGLLIPSIVSTDAVKNKIVNSLETGLNRKVQIDDINMSWSNGIEIKNIHIKERDDLPGDTFVKINRIFCNMDFIPLIKKQFRIHDLIVENPEIIIQKDKEGRFNYEDMGKAVEPSSKPIIDRKQPPDRGDKSVEKRERIPLSIPPLLLDLKMKAEVRNGKVTFIDHQLQEETIIRDLYTTLFIDSLSKPIAMKSRFEIETNGKIEHADISLNVSLAKDGQIAPGNARGTFNIETGFARITSDFDMTRFMGEGGSGLDFSMSLDLRKFTEDLAAILGIPKGMKIEGLVNSKITARGQFEKTIGIDGIVEIADLNLSGGPLGDKPIQQSSIKLIQKADIDITNDRVTVYKVSLESNFAEILIAGLVNDLRGACNVNLKTSLNLDMTKLMSEIGVLLPEGIDVAGVVQSNINLKGTQSRMEAQGKTDLRNMYVKTGTIGPVQEPEIQIIHDVIYGSEDSNIELKVFNIDTSFAEIKSSGTVNQNREIDLSMLLTSDIGKLTQSLQGIMPLPEGLNIKGKIDADIRASGSIENELKLAGATILRSISATGGPLGNNNLSDMDFTLAHTLRYKNTEDTVSIEQMNISSDFLKMESKGWMAGLSKERKFDYELSMNVDLDRITERFAGMLPSGMIMTGNGMVDLNANGKLQTQENKNLPAGTTPAHTDISGLPALYKQINFNGNMSMGQINYDAYEIKDFTALLFLEDGLFTTKDFAFTLNEGTGAVSASANLREEKPPLAFDLKLSDVNINQNMDVLAYIVPLLAAPDGKMTGKLDMKFNANGNGLNWQDDLSKSLNGKGEIVIKDGYINGGLITSRILNALGKEGEYRFDTITTGFEVSNSRISSDDISVNGKEFDIGLSGWTSFDGQIEYSADAEALDKYVGRDAKRLLSGLGKGSKLPIAVTGTIKRPKLSFKWPKPQDIGNILQGILGGSEDSKQQPDKTNEPSQTEYREREEETPPVEKEREHVIEKLFKEFLK